MNRNRKSRGGGGGARVDYHSNRGSRMRSVPAEGVYSNPHFMHAATAQVGNIVRIKAASGNVWEGVFKTFSSQFEVVLEVAAKVENAESHNSSLAADTFVDKLIFRPNDIISMSARDVDLDYPTKDVFQTDAAISARLNGQSGMGDEKILEPWVPPSSVNGGDTSLQLEPGSNGWDANDMFMTNEQSYGVQSTYDHTLTGYTVQLQATDSQDYREAEAKANEIAKEIENQPSYKARIELENGDEEERFAAVARPKPNQEFNKVEVENNSDKYVPPAKRKGPVAGKGIRSTPPPAGPVVSATSTNLKGAVPPMPYPTHPSPHANNNNNNGTREQAIIHNMHQTPPPQVQQHQQQQQHMPLQTNQQQQQQQQHQMTLPQMNHRPHSHTPPAHVYNRPPMKQMNGETKQMPQRPPRNVYPSPNMVQQSMHYQEQSSQPSQLQQQQQPPPMQSQQQHQKQDLINNVPRHREESSKDLHKFSQEFKLAAISDQEPKQHPMPQPTPPQQQPQQSISPQQQDNLDKPSTVKKSSLNPDAKEFVMNPTAKPFTPRSPITPTASRPHTPQTPSNSYIPTTGNGPPGSVSLLFPYPHCMPSCPPQTQGNRLRKFMGGPMRNDMSHVAAATGQPLLHNMPSPMQPFAYTTGVNPNYLRMFESPQLQYIPQNPPNIPNAAQPPPPYSTGQPQQPPPPQQFQGPLIYPLITAPHMMQAGMPYVQQPPPPPQGISVFMSHHQPQQHGPNP